MKLPGLRGERRELHSLRLIFACNTNPDFPHFHMPLADFRTDDVRVHRKNRGAGLGIVKVVDIFVEDIPPPFLSPERPAQIREHREGRMVHSQHRHGWGHVPVRCRQEGLRDGGGHGADPGIGTPLQAKMKTSFSIFYERKCCAGPARKGGELRRRGGGGFSFFQGRPFSLFRGTKMSPPSALWTLLALPSDVSGR